ncbi:hypothetical protein IAR55_003366 [Kwoniella newhampshirensis]|uniref:Developmental regulatory protein wetA n=1 Tax=Kwoniella newhampshirensis TaxID=1651941 RepID=A0AAW0YM98_9TREE
MASFFEPDAYLFDPSTQYDPNSFLTFSSFSDLPSNWDDLSLSDSKQPPANSVSDSSSPAPSDPFEIVNCAFEPSTPAEAEVGIFVAPSKAASFGPRDSQAQTYTQRSTSSSDTWESPVTPSANQKLASDTFAFGVSGNEFYVPASQTGFAWDQATPSISGSSYTPPTPVRPAHRIASNPVLNTNRRPRTIKPISSMPALREEDQMTSTGSQWFSGADFTEGQGSLLPPANISDATEEKLVDDFDWVFGDYGLGEAAPADGTIFAAFKEEGPTDSIEMTQPLSHNPLDPSFIPPASSSSMSNWLPQASAPDVIGLGQFDFSSQHNLPQTVAPFTIDPMAVMGTNGTDEESSRPSTAPGLNGGEGRGMLSVPMADMMMKSLSSEGYVPSRHAPPRDLFSYAPQQIPSGPPGPQPLYTSDPSPSYAPVGHSNFLRSTPLSPSPASSKRAVSHNLTVQIHPPAMSTYVPSPFPPTPQSATFPSSLSAAQSQPIPMQRAGTNPLPTSKKSMGSVYPSSLPGSTGLPAHLARAQAIVQMQEANEEAQRQVIRQRNAMKRVGMAEASVMQPTAGARRPQAIMGWEGPSAQTGTMPVLTSTPLVTVHPPPAQYYFTGAPVPTHRVHPPPHPGTTAPTSRPIARLPSPSKASRKASSSQLSPNRTTPSKVRSPSGKRKVTPANGGGGGFSWGETTFINFTSDDAEKLLTGVAPSGSQSKRKREEEAAAARVTVDMVDEEDRLRSKRSRSDE